MRRNKKEKEPVFGEAKIDFTVDCTNNADEVMIRVSVKEKALETYCAAEISALRNVLEVVSECL